MNFKSRVYKAIVHQKLKNHQPYKMVFNLFKANYIGILFDADSEKNIESVLAYESRLKQLDIKVRLLGYYNSQFNGKEVSFPFFCKSGLNWYNIPNDIEVENFTRYKFDILINAYQKKLKPLEYVSLFSNAKFRIGRYFDGDGPHPSDMMINTEETQTMEEFISQLNNFLENINRDATAV